MNGLRPYGIAPPGFRPAPVAAPFIAAYAALYPESRIRYAILTSPAPADGVPDGKIPPSDVAGP